MMDYHVELCNSMLGQEIRKAREAMHVVSRKYRGLDVGVRRLVREVLRQVARGNRPDPCTTAAEAFRKWYMSHDRLNVSWMASWWIIPHRVPQRPDIISFTV
jgi:hypothetical protein